MYKLLKKFTVEAFITVLTNHVIVYINRPFMIAHRENSLKLLSSFFYLENVIFKKKNKSNLNYT